MVNMEYMYNLLFVNNVSQIWTIYIYTGDNSKLKKFFREYIKWYFTNF